MNQATDLLLQPFNSRSEARVGNKCICQGLNKCFLKPRWYFSRAETKQLYYMLYGSLLSRDGRQPRHTHTQSTTTGLRACCDKHSDMCGARGASEPV